MLDYIFCSNCLKGFDCYGLFGSFCGSLGQKWVIFLVFPLQFIKLLSEFLLWLVIYQTDTLTSALNEKAEVFFGLF